MKWVKLGRRHYAFGFERISNKQGCTYTLGFGLGLGILNVYNLGQSWMYDALIDGLEIAFWPRKDIVPGDIAFEYIKKVYFRMVSRTHILRNRKMYGI